MKFDVMPGRRAQEEEGNLDRERGRRNPQQRFPRESGNGALCSDGGT